MTEIPVKHNMTKAQYEKLAIIAKASADEMIARLDVVALQPKRILEVGCATGYMTALLKKHYPTADLIALDLSEDFLRAGQHSFHKKIDWINSAPHQLPIRTQSVDMLVANLVLPWCMNWMKVLEEWCRVLRPEGLLMITTLGPDTLQEWAKKDAIRPYFLDMHHLGDGLLQANFADPILDVEHIILSYKDSQKMLYELQMTQMIQPDDKGSVPTDLQVTFEIVFGHAWGALPRESTHTMNISLESLRRQVLSKL